MATRSAIAATSEAVVRLLRANYSSADFDGNTLEFQVYTGKEFEKPMTAGVSLLLYRIYHNGAHRTPPGRPLPNGQRRRPNLPLELHFLLTAWAGKASLQHEIAGWMMRVMEDNPILPAGLLNAYRPAVFQFAEEVEITLGQLSIEDLFHIWEVIAAGKYQISVPYQARVINIESPLPAAITGAPVEERQTEKEADGGTSRS